MYIEWKLKTQSLLGRKRKKSKTSNYIISCDPTDLSRQADGFVGKLRSNVFGTTFFVYDNGSKTNQDELRQDMAVIVYVRHTFISYFYHFFLLHNIYFFFFSFVFSLIFNCFSHQTRTGHKYFGFQRATQYDCPIAWHDWRWSTCQNKFMWSVTTGIIR